LNKRFQIVSFRIYGSTQDLLAGERLVNNYLEEGWDIVDTHTSTGKYLADTMLTVVMTRDGELE
jgi:hypothetical protein